MKSGLRAQALAFRSTPPREGRHLFEILAASTGSVFRSTPPREGRRAQRGHPGAGGRFDPRPRVRGDLKYIGKSGMDAVSIHAPA